MVRDLKKSYITSYTIYGIWFEHFIIGMHKRMRDEVYQDQAVALEVLYKLMERFESDYFHSKLNEKREYYGSGYFCAGGFLGSFKGRRREKQGTTCWTRGKTLNFLMYCYHLGVYLRERQEKVSLCRCNCDK